jgi:hypothetical protein
MREWNNRLTTPHDSNCLVVRPYKTRLAEKEHGDIHTTVVVVRENGTTDLQHPMIQTVWL